MDMGKPIAYNWAIGDRRVDLGAVMLGGGTGNYTFWVVNMGGDLLYGEDSGEVPPPGGDTDNRENTH